MTSSLLLNTATPTFGELFTNGRTFAVPRFQRNYKWDEDQWEELWQDLVAAAENDKHINGAGGSDSTLRVDRDRSLSATRLVAAAFGALLDGAAWPHGELLAINTMMTTSARLALTPHVEYILLLTNTCTYNTTGSSSTLDDAVALARRAVDAPRKGAQRGGGIVVDVRDVDADTLAAFKCATHGLCSVNSFFQF